jgi:hypothetical protein
MSDKKEEHKRKKVRLNNDEERIDEKEEIASNETVELIVVNPASPISPIPPIPPSVTLASADILESTRTRSLSRKETGGKAPRRPLDIPDYSGLTTRERIIVLEEDEREFPDDDLDEDWDDDDDDEDESDEDEEDESDEEEEDEDEEEHDDE